MNMPDERHLALIDLLECMANEYNMYQEDRNIIDEVIAALIAQRDALRSCYSEGCNGESSEHTASAALGIEISY